MIKDIWITDKNFLASTSESAITGMGAMVGVDTYSEKGVVRLAKKSTAITSGFDAQPHFIDMSAIGAYAWIQLANGRVLYSADGGSNFSDTSFPTGSACSGNGLIYFQGYMFGFTDGGIYYINAGTPTAGWTSWKSGLNTLNSSPITNVHTPFLYPSSRGFYFCNGGSIGFVGQNGTTTFNPAGTAGTAYIYNDSIFTLPSLTYTTTTLEFLPPSNLAIAAYPYQSPGQGADLITWDTTSVNKFNPPLRMYSESYTNGATLTGGIKQMVSRNQVLYVVSGGNHTIYETNGSTFNIVDNVALFSSLRTAGNAESTAPVYFNSYPQGICILGNKLLTAAAPLTNTSTYPASGYGYFPTGVWSVSFNDDGTKSTQCEFVLPLTNSLVGPIGNGYFSKISCIRPISVVGSSTTKLLAGFGLNNALLPNIYGVIAVDMFNYIDNIDYVAIESPIYQIGTPINPGTVSEIEITMNRKLLTGQTIDMAYRKNPEDNWTTLQTFTGDGTTDIYHIDANSIGSTVKVQFRFRMATGSGGTNITESPELRSIKLS